MENLDLNNAQTMLIQHMLSPPVYFLFVQNSLRLWDPNKVELELTSQRLFHHEIHLDGFYFLASFIRSMLHSLQPQAKSSTC